jgi:hypothetical protein
MTKEYVPYELAVKLKKLGFDEPCFGFWSKIHGLFITTTSGKLNEDAGECLAPTFSQAFRWFRDKYDIRHNIMDFIDDETGIEWDYEIATIGTDLDENGCYKPLVDYSTDDENRKFKTYEEAELACLTNLIEIVESKSE